MGTASRPAARRVVHVRGPQRAALLSGPPKQSSSASSCQGHRAKQHCNDAAPAVTLQVVLDTLETFRPHWHSTKAVQCLLSQLLF